MKNWKSCLDKHCNSRNRKPVWEVDGVPVCNPCYERWQENHFLDEHRVLRLSDDDRDFDQDVQGRSYRRGLTPAVN